jgi:hypothetical protein
VASPAIPHRLPLLLLHAHEAGRSGRMAAAGGAEGAGASLEAQCLPFLTDWFRE